MPTTIFYDGMPNVNEKLNELYANFAAGPYSAVPLSGGTMTGPLYSPLVVGTSAGGLANPRAILGDIGEMEPSSNLARYSSTGTNDFVWSWVNGFGTHQMVFSSIGAFGTADQKADRRVALAVQETGVRTVFDFTFTGNVRARNTTPTADNTYDIGSASNAYRTVYARTGTINTSDADLKDEFRTMSEVEINAAQALARAIGAYKWKDSILEKGDGAREHIGPTVQAAIAILRAHDLDPFNYGFICYDSWDREVVEHPSTESAEARIEVVREAGQRYAFRFAELQLFIARGQQAVLDDMQQRLSGIEAAAAT